MRMGMGGGVVGIQERGSRWECKLGRFGWPVKIAKE